MSTDTEPVLIFGLSKDYFISLLAAAVSFCVAFGIWNPTPDQVAAITALFGSLWAIVSTIVNLVTRSRVTPVAGTARTGRRADRS